MDEEDLHGIVVTSLVVCAFSAAIGGVMLYAERRKRKAIDVWEASEIQKIHDRNK